MLIRLQSVPSFSYHCFVRLPLFMFFHKEYSLWLQHKDHIRKTKKIHHLSSPCLRFVFSWYIFVVRMLFSRLPWLMSSVPQTLWRKFHESYKERQLTRTFDHLFLLSLPFNLRVISLFTFFGPVLFSCRFLSRSVSHSLSSFLFPVSSKQHLLLSLINLLSCTSCVSGENFRRYCIRRVLLSKTIKESCQGLSLICLSPGICVSSSCWFIRVWCQRNCFLSWAVIPGLTGSESRA